MGSGKRNYRALRFTGRKKKQDTRIETKEKKEPPKEEDIKGLLALWQEKNKSKVKECD